MDNLDFGLLSVLIIVAPLLFSAIPPIIVGVAGGLVIRKRYVKSGSAIVASAVLNLILTVGNMLAIRLLGPEWYGLVFGYIGHALGLLSGGLLAGGFLGLVLRIPRASTTASDPVNR